MLLSVLTNQQGSYPQFGIERSDTTFFHKFAESDLFVMTLVEADSMRSLMELPG